MSMMDLRYLGLTSEEIKALRDIVRGQHGRGGMQTATVCTCGSGSGGPAGTLLCRVLEKLEDAGQAARLNRTPRRDPAICDHQVEGKLQLWEYQGKVLCELCSQEVAC